RALRRPDERRLHQRLASGWSTALLLDEPVPAGGLVRRRRVSRAGRGNTGADRSLRRSLRTKAPAERELAAGPRTKENGASEETPASMPTDSSALLGGLWSRRRDCYVTTLQGRGGAAHVVSMHLVLAV